MHISTPEIEIRLDAWTVLEDTYIKDNVMQVSRRIELPSCLTRQCQQAKFVGLNPGTRNS